MSEALARGSLRPYGAFFLTYFGFMGVYSPYLALYLADLHFSAFEIGVLMSMLQVVRIVGPNLWGWIADHARSRARVVRQLAVLSLTVFVALFFARGLAAMCAVLVLLNLFLSGMAPICEALTVQRIGGDFSRYGRIRLWGSLGFIVAVTTGGAALDALGVSNMPTLALALLLTVVAATFRVVDAPHAQQLAAPAALGALLRRPQVIAFFTSCFLMVAAHAALYAYLSLYLEQLGYTKTAIGLLWALGVVAEVLFFYFQPHAMTRISVGILLLGSFGVAAVRFAIIGTLAQSLAWLLFAQVLHAITFGVHHAASLAILRQWFTGPLAARGQALYVSVSYGLGGSAGGLLAATIWVRISPAAVFIVSGMIAVVGALAVLWMRRAEAVSGSAQHGVVT